MIHIGCILKVHDNTGISKIKVIGVLKRQKRIPKVGDVVVASIQKTLSPVYKKSSIIMAMIIKTKKALIRKDGSTLSYLENASIIVDKTGSPKGTHIFGPVPIEIKEKNKKIATLTNSFI